MSKCHVRELRKVYTALFQDAVAAFPTLRTEFEKDLTRLLSLVERRGLRVYLEDLPAVGKHLDRCLSGGEYKLSGLPLTKRFSGRVVIPKFLRGLYLLVFHETGRLKDDCSIEAVFFLRQLLYAAKKASVACSSSAVSTEVEAFFELDQTLPEPEGYWNVASTRELEEVPYYGFSKSPLYAARVACSDTVHRIRLSNVLARIDLVSVLVTSSLGSYDPSDWKFRHGPGAVSDAVGPSNKYCWKNWSDRLESEYPIADYGYHSYGGWADSSGHRESIGSQEPYSRMVAVPKSYSKPRLIAAEPSEHMWCQQNMLHYFAEGIRTCWISKFARLNDQTRNQQLCSFGASSGTLATVDLSAASDRVTCHAVGQFFRSNRRLLSCLRASRTRRLQQTLTPRVPEFVDLRKFSTMGNACTFPVETLLFLGIALSCVLETRGLKTTLRNIESLQGEVAVFGDDIVIPVDSRELFVAALEVLHFKVNLNKSFWSGNFRESCGVDSFKGENVTPAYWKTCNDGKPESLASTIETSNNFYQKYLLATAGMIASTVGRDVPVLPMRSGAFGLKVRTSNHRSVHRTRWNGFLFRAESLVATLSSSQEKTSIEGYSALLQYFTEEPDPMIHWQSGYLQRPRLKIKRRWVAIQDL